MGGAQPGYFHWWKVHTGVARAKARARVQVRGVVLSKHFLGRAQAETERIDWTRGRTASEQNTFSVIGSHCCYEFYTRLVAIES